MARLLHSGENQPKKASLKNKQDLKPQKQNKDTIESSPSVSKKRRQEDKQTNKPKHIQSKINIKERQRTLHYSHSFNKEKKISIKQAKNKQTNKA